jgi:protein dithiol oxidoreductase (disulfide-forming)
MFDGAGMTTSQPLSPRRAFMRLLAALAAACALVPAVQAQELVEGKQYLRLKQPQLVESGNKIEVIEFFSYGCPHCAELEPVLAGWVKKLPADVQFKRVPVMFQDRWVNLGKIYYTLDAMGEDAKLSPEVFSAMHAKGLSMWDSKVFFDWAASKGLDRKKVEDMFGSFAVQGRMNRAMQLAKAYNIQSVPTLVVDGKFVTGSDKVGTHAALPAALDALIAKARAERPKT